MSVDGARVSGGCVERVLLGVEGHFRLMVDRSNWPLNGARAI